MLHALGFEAVASSITLRTKQTKTAPVFNTNIYSKTTTNTCVLDHQHNNNAQHVSQTYKGNFNK